MSKAAVLLLAIASVVVPVSRAAQDPVEAQRAPDGGTRETLISIYIPPVPNEPFTTSLNTQWTRTLEDGNTLTLQNHRIIMRDSTGKIFQERCILVPSGRETTVNRFEISDPIKHRKYFCDPYRHSCELRNYFAPTSIPVVTGPMRRAGGNTSSESLGTKMISGVEATGTRETTLIKAAVVGTNQPLKITNEFWYSPRLGFNLMVKREDPRHGTQTFEVHDLSQGEPDATFFSVPPGYSVIDLRRK